MDYAALPKIDLHLHLDGAVRTRTMLDLGDRLGIPLPGRTARELDKYVTVGRDCRSLRDFLDRFDVYMPVLRSAESMERIAYELCEDQARDGVIYFETRFAPLLQDGPQFSLEASVEAVLSGLRRGARDFGVRWGLILCFIRQAEPESSIATARAAKKFRDQGVVGIDIAGDESIPAAPHAEGFRLARKLDVGITVHAGEAGPAANIREAVYVLGAHRIGHGTKLVTEPALLEELARRKVGIEVCLTSNLQTRSVPSIARHPLPKMLEAGVHATLNTDDPAVSRTTLSKEFARAEKSFGFGREEFVRLLENSVDAAFATPGVKRELRAKIRAAWSTQRGRRTR